jgi:hypothetical protein
VTHHSRIRSSPGILFEHRTSSSTEVRPVIFSLQKYLGI